MLFFNKNKNNDYKINLSVTNDDIKYAQDVMAGRLPRPTLTDEELVMYNKVKINSIAELKEMLKKEFSNGKKI